MAQFGPGQTDGVGIYDRDYYRQGRSGFRLRAPRSAVGAIILINVAVYVVEMVDCMVPPRYARCVLAFHPRPRRSAAGKRLSSRRAGRTAV